MKRFVLAAFAATSFVTGTFAADDVYINTGIVDSSTPAPVIDATTFINYGYFGVQSGYSIIRTNFSTNVISVDYGQPYGTQHTLNYSNFNQMAASPGFDLSFRAETNSPPGTKAAWFVNAGSVSEVNAIVYGTSKLLISATNIIDRGTLAVGGRGLLSISGDHVDLSRGLIETIGQESDPAAFIKDWYWGVDTNELRARFSPPVRSSPMTNMFSVSGPFPNHTITLPRAAPEFTSYVQTTPGEEEGDPQFVDVLLLGNTNPAISTAVAFIPGDNDSITKVIRWRAIFTNKVTKVLTTNDVYLRDTFAGTTDPQLVFSDSAYSNGGQTYHPENYTVTRFYPGFNNLPVISPGTYDSSIFTGTNPPPIFVTNTAYGVTLTPAPYNYDTSIAHATYTNVAGRIEIEAAKTLDLSRTRINGQSFLKVICTNHFIGASNATVNAAYSSFDIATTNGNLPVVNWTTPLVPVMIGTIEVWSGRWTNANAQGVSSIYNVTMVKSELASGTPAKVFDLTVRNQKEVVIRDALNVINSVLIDAERLTVATNPPGLNTARGELNFVSPELFWSPNLPRLRYLTNDGKISLENSVYFAGARRPPWFTGTFDEPYDAFVNRGEISSQGNETWAKYLEFSGTNDAGFGPITVRADTGFLRRGLLWAPSADVTLMGGGLTVSNELIYAGRRINLAPTGFIDDGSLSGTIITNNRNIWYAGLGINLLSMPVHASLLNTVVTNTAYAEANVFIRWAAADNGCNTGGFVDNAALGQLVLDGGENSLFTFVPVTGNNALYVNVLELRNYAAITNSAGDLTGVQVQPGFKIYYSQARANGAAISLDGRNGGAFCQVSGFTAAFMATNGVVISGTPGSGGGSTGGGTGGTESGPPRLAFPVGNTVPGTALPNLFSAARGTYYGLFSDTNGVTTGSSGLFIATVGASGAYSARVQLGSSAYPLAGRFDAQGHATVTANRPGLPALRVELQLDTSAANQISGHISNGSWVGKLLADRADRTMARSTFAGNYTFVVPADLNSANSPDGHGYGRLKVSAAGTASWSANLADGTKLVQRTIVSGDGVWPMYAAAYGGRGLLISWGQLASSGLGGQAIWIKPAGVPGKSYPPGFTNQVQLSGSRFAPQGQAKRAVELFNGYGRLIFSGGNLSHPFTNSVKLDLKNRSLLPGPNKLNLKISAGSGLFSGSVINPETGKRLGFQGALLQEDNFGAGFFLGTDLSGAVLLVEPTP